MLIIIIGYQRPFENKAEILIFNLRFFFLIKHIYYITNTLICAICILFSETTVTRQSLIAIVTIYNCLKGAIKKKCRLCSHR